MRKLTQFTIFMAATAVLVTCVVSWYTSRETLPSEIRIAAGKKGGLYHKLAEHLEKKLRRAGGPTVRVIETGGSDENLRKLQVGDAELAFIQADSLTPEGVAAIAPLFPEPMFLLARKEKKIRSLADLAERRVTLGPKGSGARKNATTVLTHYQVPLDKLQDTEEYFDALANDPKLDAAVFTTGWMNPKLDELLKRGDLELIGIDRAEGLATRYPWFTTTTISRGLFVGKSPIPPAPVPTVSVMALLVVRANESDWLVRETLAALYKIDLRAEFPSALTAKAAKDYDAAIMHPSVADYHDPSAGLNRLGKAMEMISKSKEGLFGAGAFVLFVWGWIRRRREQAAEAADKIQREKLDAYIGQTLEVELQQMEVTDPEELRPFLRRVTKIKQEALLELTSEKVRGDQLFAIFLSQCAALSEKIQMRMMYGRMSEEKV